MDNWEKEQRNFIFYRTREGRGLNWGRSIILKTN